MGETVADLPGLVLGPGGVRQGGPDVFQNDGMTGGRDDGTGFTKRKYPLVI